MYYFYMGSVLLPIAPEKFTLKIKNQNKTVTLINEGEVNILKDAGLTELEFDVLIPAVKYSFATYEDGFKKSSYFTDHFEKLKTSKKPFEFKIIRQMPDGKLLFDNKLTVSLESYTTTENANEGFDLKVSIKLKQYKHFGTKVVVVSAPENNTAIAKVETQRETENSPAPTQETTYTVKSGDTLWNIAKKFYGDGKKYTVIYEANKDKITNPNVIRAGQVLVIPNASGAVSSTTTISPTGNPVRIVDKTNGNGKPTNNVPTSNSYLFAETVKTSVVTVICSDTSSFAGSFSITYTDANKKSVTVSGKTKTCSVNAAKGTMLTVTIKSAKGHSFKTTTTGLWSGGSTMQSCMVKDNASLTITWVR